MSVNPLLFKLANSLSSFASAPTPLSQLAVQYKATRSPSIFDQIYSAMQPAIQQYVNKFRASGMDPDLLETQLQLLLRDALLGYDPSKGSFETYARSYFQKIYRFVNDHQSALRLPENYKLNYATFEATSATLEQKLGRPPTISEITAASGLPAHQVRAMAQRSVAGLTEDTWAKFTDDTSLHIKEGLEHVKAKYGAPLARAIEEVHLGNTSLAEFCRRNNIDYSSFYNKYRMALEDFKWFAGQ